MKQVVSFVFCALSGVAAFAQPSANKELNLIIEKTNPVTAVKNQQETGTCWCYSGTSLLESQFLKANPKAAQPDLSEMYTVRNIYREKANNYFLRQGKAQLSEGGLGHDVIRAIALYGAVPQSAYSGLPAGVTTLNHAKLIKGLKEYLDAKIAAYGSGKRDGNWHAGVDSILDENLGKTPADFVYEGKTYTPASFAKDYMKFNPADYVNITSFTDHPYNEPFIISVPDNFSNGAYYNVPLNEMTALVKDAVKGGYTVLWDADVSNNGFVQNRGIALNIARGTKITSDSAFDMEEQQVTPESRQALYENLTTQDDHLMHIAGIEKSKGGKTFFLVKNSWGEVGPYKGYINVSEEYFANNTISLVIPKAALSKSMLAKLNIK